MNLVVGLSCDAVHRKMTRTLAVHYVNSISKTSSQSTLSACTEVVVKERVGGVATPSRLGYEVSDLYSLVVHFALFTSVVVVAATCSACCQL